MNRLFQFLVILNGTPILLTMDYAKALSTTLANSGSNLFQIECSVDNPDNEEIESQNIRKI